MSVVAHTVLFVLSVFAAFMLAHNFRGLSNWFFVLFLPFLAITVPIKIFVFALFKQYRRSWRYVGMRDLIEVVKASYWSTFGIVSAYFLVENGWKSITGDRLIQHKEELRQVVFFLDLFGTFGLVSASRVLVRFYFEWVKPGDEGTQVRVLIMGAGDAGESLLREIHRSSSDRYEVVGFLDDESSRHGASIHGVEVMGPTDDVKYWCERLDVDEILIAIPSATPGEFRRLVELCEGTNLRFRTVPALADLIEGRVQVSQFRDVEIEDLLGRDPVTLNTDAIGAQLRGKIVCVTGAGGSIGSEMCRQVAQWSPKKLVLIEQAENNLFEIDRELRQSNTSLSIIPYVADIADEERIRAIFKLEKPSSVFHAAAHKHVPMMEINPGEAVKNNVRGTRVVADAAVAAGVERMVMISTDKAVNPTSIMGCSKRVAELYVQQMSTRSKTQFVTVRFGNVLGSSGSVIPIFKEQIARGGPVTVTHPDMTRYFMTIPEAAQLVLQAGTMGQGGDIFVLDMGEPVKIVDLAREMITLSGLRPDVDIEVTFTGMRPGEKLYEELLIEGEDVMPTDHPKIGIWRHRAEDWEALCAQMQSLIDIADTATAEEIRERLGCIVPEYQPKQTMTPKPSPSKAVTETQASNAAAESLKTDPGPAFGV